jgi:hypothetical protein
MNPLMHYKSRSLNYNENLITLIKEKQQKVDYNPRKTWQDNGIL